MTKKLLFICSQNRLRSPTAEAVFREYAGLETASAGLDPYAETPVTPELLKWACLIFVMEKSHRNRLLKTFKRHVRGKRICCLDIPDIFDYMDPTLIRILKERVPYYLGKHQCDEANN